jgi:hypothetical protein
MTEKYDKLPLSKKTISGMSLTPDDQKWIKLLFDRQDNVIEQFIKDAYDFHATLIIDEVRKLLDEHKIEVLTALERIERDVKEIKSDTLDLKNKIADHEFRIHRIESRLGIEK